MPPDNQASPTTGQGTTPSSSGQVGGPVATTGQAPVPGGLIGSAGVAPSGSSFRSYVPTDPSDSSRGPSGRETR
jgi:hypothetical protein